MKWRHFYNDIIVETGQNSTIAIKKPQHIIYQSKADFILYKIRAFSGCWKIHERRTRTMKKGFCFFTPLFPENPVNFGHKNNAMNVYVLVFPIYDFPTGPSTTLNASRGENRSLNRKINRKSSMCSSEFSFEWRKPRLDCFIRSRDICVQRWPGSLCVYITTSH